MTLQEAIQLAAQANSQEAQAQLQDYKAEQTNDDYSKQHYYEKARAYYEAARHLRKSIEDAGFILGDFGQILPGPETRPPRLGE
nr:hypothetical protein [uncultured Undibacterium sp.]